MISPTHDCPSSLEIHSVCSSPVDCPCHHRWSLQWLSPLSCPCQQLGLGFTLTEDTSTTSAFAATFLPFSSLSLSYKYNGLSILTPPPFCLLLFRHDLLSQPDCHLVHHTLPWTSMPCRCHKYVNDHGPVIFFAHVLTVMCVSLGLFL